jgi:hypothetical protein
MRRVATLGGTTIPDRIVAVSVSVEIDDTLQLLLDFGGATCANVSRSFTVQQYRIATLELYGMNRRHGEDWAVEGYDVAGAGGVGARAGDGV